MKNFQSISFFYIIINPVHNIKTLLYTHILLYLILTQWILALRGIVLIQSPFHNCVIMWHKANSFISWCTEFLIDFFQDIKCVPIIDVICKKRAQGQHSRKVSKFPYKVTKVKIHIPFHLKQEVHGPYGSPDLPCTCLVHQF